MAVEIKSKKGVVSKAPHELYMVFTDMRNFVQFLPEDKKQGVTADYDSIQRWNTLMMAHRSTLV